jgi:hypothetical protein
MNQQHLDACGDKDVLIESLRGELSVLEKQVEEFNDLRLSIVKVTGKNAVRALKSKVLTSSDRLNGYHIGEYLRKVLWPDVKMMPTKWEKWSEHPKSICQRILSAIGVPRQVTKEEYWLCVGTTMANDKLCAIQSNVKQTMHKQFMGKKWSAWT